jgi:anion-transporting  ArsA/GET3 family ATPase
VFGTEFESMKGFSGMEKLRGDFLQGAGAADALGPGPQHVACRQSAGAVAEIRHDRTGILKDQKDILDSRYKTSEASLIKVIERRKVTMANLETTQKRIEELNPLLLDIENQIAASTNQKAPDRTGKRALEARDRVQ